MKFLFTIVIVFLVTQLNGQVLFNNIYEKPFWNYGDAVIERQDGNYLILGSSRNPSDTDFVMNILLIDSIGNLIWDKYFENTNGGNFLIETSDNNFLAVGTVTTSTTNPHLVKFDSDGNVIWEQTYETPTWGDGYSVGETINNNYYFVGSDLGSTILFVTDQQGNLLWSRTYSLAYIRSITQTYDGGFILTGNTEVDNFDYDIILLKVDSNGDQLWTKLYGGEGEDDARSVTQLPDGGYIVAGEFDTQIIDGYPFTYLIRTNSIGDTIWTKKHLIGESQHIRKLNNGNGFILSSSSIGDINLFIYITKLDLSGNIVWSRGFYPGYLYSVGNNVTETSDGGFLLTGSTSNWSSESDIRLIKLDSLGNFVLSIDDYKKESSLISVFPNPARNEINFQLNSTIGNQIQQIEIFSSLGQKLKKITSLEKTNLKVNIESFVDGLYFYKITTVKNQIITGKFLVKK